ncbi:MAG TPA: VOC family protein [Gemmatimonadaceae bacterium]|nr:VOC family protein [Gemmatimonadaceae bacterium]
MSDVASELAVRGLGGVFLYTDEPKALADWYHEHLGLETRFNEAVGAYYHEFRQRELTDASRLLRTTWAILPRPDGAAHARAGVVVNYLVPDLAALIAHLTDAGIQVEKEERYDYGHFAWIRDPEDNRIELFQDFASYLPPDI